MIYLGPVTNMTDDWASGAVSEEKGQDISQSVFGEYQYAGLAGDSTSSLVQLHILSLWAHEGHVLAARFQQFS